jgi:acetoin utilization protein AcuB
MRLGDIMSTEVSTVSPSESAEAAWELMRRGNFRHLVVVDKKRVVGVLSQRDLGGPRGAALRKGKLVEELMTPDVVSAPAGITVRAAANLMRGNVIGCLPVIEGSQKGAKIAGIVTTSDLLDLVGRGAAKPIALTERPTLPRRGVRRRTP